MDEAVDHEALRAFFGKNIVISARAIFGPSGRVLRVEADSMEEATGDVSMWSVTPPPLDRSVERRALAVPQGPKIGINAIWGQWPGGESDDEVDKWLCDPS